MIDLCSVCMGWHRATPKTFEFPEVEDIHPAFCSSGFMVTNEQPEVFDELLGDMKFERAAAICSGGEMLLFMLLPRITGELIAVDHSYRALGAAIVKAQMLVSLGAKACREMFIVERNHVNIQAVAQPFREALPPRVKEALRHPDSDGHLLFDERHCKKLRPHWFFANVNNLEAAIKNIRKLKFVHGDFRDVAPKGPFDLLYLSNMWQHNDRDGVPPKKEQFNPMLKTMGYALQTDYSSVPGWNGPATHLLNWKSLKSMASMRESTSSWVHYLIQKVAP